jgi:hypothetical protein
VADHSNPWTLDPLNPFTVYLSHFTFYHSHFTVHFLQLYGKADIKYAVAARANEKPFGCIAVLIKDAVEAVFIAAFRAILELVFEFDLFYFSIHHFTCFAPRRKVCGLNG